MKPEQIYEFFAEFIEANCDLVTALEILQETYADDHFIAANPRRRYWARRLNRIETEFIRLKDFEIPGSPGGTPLMVVKRLQDGNFARFPRKVPFDESHAPELDDYLASRLYQVAAAEFVN